MSVEVPAQEKSQTSIDVIFSADEIAERIASLAANIAAARLDNLLVVSILKGSFIFAGDLIRALHHVGLSPEVDFLSLASYKDKTVSSGTVEIIRDLETDVSGRNLLLVDDILESGRTLSFACDLVKSRGAKTVETCVLLDKPHKRAVAIEASYVAFECPDVFVIGYGMDLAHRYRELPYVGKLNTPSKTS